MFSQCVVDTVVGRHNEINVWGNTGDAGSTSRSICAMVCPPPPPPLVPPVSGSKWLHVLGASDARAVPTHQRCTRGVLG